MAIHESIDGVVVKTWDLGETDRYLSVLTAEKGRISILSKGSHSIRGSQLSVSQLYTYGNFEYYRKGKTNILKDGTAYQPFYGLSKDLDKMNLSAYLCELVCELTDEGIEAGDFLRLLLNAFHALSYNLKNVEQVKSAFEFRTAILSGYEPDISGCCACGVAESNPFYFDVMNGAIYCSECWKKRQTRPHPSGAYADELREAEIVLILTPAVVSALRYCAVSPLERILSFELKDPDDMQLLSKTAETYILSHIGHGFDALDFYHTMRRK